MAIRFPNEIAAGFDQVAIALTALDQRPPQRTFGRICRNKHEHARAFVQRHQHRIGGVAGEGTVQPLQPDTRMNLGQSRRIDDFASRRLMKPGQ